ncbi:AEC family transporter [Pseudovibrio sp. JE062]|uniref:AEC family transporter n=1 Tax=Pseudovibrio sp. JE062 TaxID=439495 RepID=UPI000186C09F|nr:AEC family transporter [Pseudovibrio sp. JE062]EEA94441.1 auxin efflux carrier family protein [Pseudovibrio sp. JE062]
MAEIVLIVFCLVIGIVLRLTKALPDTATKVFGGWVIYVALPAMAIKNVHGVTVSADWWFAAATPWIGVGFAILFFVPIGKYFKWSWQRIGALLLVAGWANTSFVGLPMISALAGSQYLGVGLVIDLFGSYLALSILGISIATVASAGAFEPPVIVRRILTFPPFWAIIVALAINHLGRPVWIDDVVGTLADTLTPMALAAVGFALRVEHLKGRWAPIGLALTFSLVLAPLFLYLVYAGLGQLENNIARIALLEMAMPPMLGASLIALQYNLESELVAATIGVGVPLSLATASLWWFFVFAG